LILPFIFQFYIKLVEYKQIHTVLLQASRWHINRGGPSVLK